MGGQRGTKNNRALPHSLWTSDPLARKVSPTSFYLPLPLLLLLALGALGVEVQEKRRKEKRTQTMISPFSLSVRNCLYRSLSQNESFSWGFVFPHSCLHLQVLGFLKVRLEDTRAKTMVNSLLIWWYFQFWSFSLICLLPFVSETSSSCSMHFVQV